MTPALDCDNLARLARVLAALEARQYADEPFGRWEIGESGEHRWVEFEPTQADREERARWRPDPADAGSFDHLLLTRHGTLDIVPEVAGGYDDLRSRAVTVEVGGREVRVESLDDQLATLTVPRREKDAERVRALRELQRRRGCSAAGTGAGSGTPLAG